uniref:Nose resistant-to-fluoxetine protein N-terminal domain-containing protein n=1 Tax=Timema bartmani TaxID=61472 RepID=A0A7R9F2Y3_9NEOP|nr:unnamed protein product [Timema bartmani]
MAVRASRAALSGTSPCRRWTFNLILFWFASTSAVDNAAERSIDGAPDMALIRQRPPSQMTGNGEEQIETDELPPPVTVIETSTLRAVFIEKIGYEDEGGSKNGSPDIEKHLKTVLNVQQEDFFEISSRNLTEVLPVIERITSEVCRNETRMLFQELARSTPWAVQIFDSSTKTPEGMVIGSTFNFGNFDECVGVRGPPRAEGESRYKGSTA